jgi:hypothetical protein
MTRTLAVFLAVATVCALFAFAPVAAQAQCATAWAPNTSYALNATVSYGGRNYRCQQAHTSLVGWEPPNTPALWVDLGACSGGATPTRTPTATATSGGGATATRTPTRVTTATPTTPSGSNGTYTQNGLTLQIIDNGGGVLQSTKDRLAQVFFSAYRAERARFNPSAPATVPVTIDPTYTGVAYTAGARVTVASAWLVAHPWDVDSVGAHEMMHVTQGYTASSNPGWAVEGMADYARYKYGLYNAQAGWSLPAYSSSQHYTDAYRVTARFFVWIEQRIRPTIMDELDDTMKAGTYTAAFWTSKTGLTVDQLWSQYGQSPAIS